VNLQFGVLRDVDLVIGAEVVRSDGIGKLMGDDINAIADLLGVHFDARAGMIGHDQNFRFRPGLDDHFAIGIVNGDDGVRLNFEMLFDVMGEGG
jgi:hypothetical protein